MSTTAVAELCDKVKMKSGEKRRLLKQYDGIIQTFTVKAADDVASADDSDADAESTAATRKATRCVRALHDADADNSDELTIREGDIIEVIEEDGEWVTGKLNDKIGKIPLSWVEEWKGNEQDAAGQVTEIQDAPDPGSPAALEVFLKAAKSSKYLPGTH